VNDRIGRIQTVRGLIEPSQLGRTLMHEHLLFDLRPLHRRADWDLDGMFADTPRRLLTFLEPSASG
jgi:phosphotriesterase-related protein